MPVSTTADDDTQAVNTDASISASKMDVDVPEAAVEPSSKMDVDDESQPATIPKAENDTTQTSTPALSEAHDDKVELNHGDESAQELDSANTTSNIPVESHGLQSQDLDVSQNAEEEAESDPNSANTALTAVEEMQIKDMTLRIGEFVYVKNDKDDENPHIVQVTALWKDLATCAFKIRFKIIKICLISPLKVAFSAP